MEMSAQGPQHFGTRKRVGEEGRFRQETAAQTPLPTRGTMYTKPFPGGRGLEPRKRSGSALRRPHHPFELYSKVVDDETLWAVYPATVNGTIEPEIGDESIFAESVPFLTDEENFEAFLEFDLTCTSWMAPDGIWRLRPGKQTLSNVWITIIPGEASVVAVNPDTGTVTPGHYVYPIGEVAAGEVVEQTRRFSVYFTLCNAGELRMSEYG